VPATAIAKRTDGKRHLKLTVHPKHTLARLTDSPPAIASRRTLPTGAIAMHAMAAGSSRTSRYWSAAELRYGWGRPGFYRGQWNGGSFGPCLDKDADRNDLELRDVTTRRHQSARPRESGDPGQAKERSGFRFPPSLFELRRTEPLTPPKPRGVGGARE